MSKRAYLPAAFLLTAVCAAGGAVSAPYSNLVVFGDSLSDAGQFPDFLSPSPTNSLRFTNRTGPLYTNVSREPFVDVAPTRLGNKLGLNGDLLSPSTSQVRANEKLPDGNNWATGGNTTRDVLASITTTSKVSLSGLTIRERPGYLVQRGFKADPNALYYINGGANDFFQGQVTSAATAGASAGRLADSVRAIQAAGGRYLMVWLLPDVGLTPLNFGTPAQAGLSQLSAAFNQELVRQLGSIPAQIIPLNVPLLFSEIIASPSTFGMVSGAPLLSTCFSGNNCTAHPVYGIGGSQPDPSKLLFNDGVHPTGAGHKIIADYAYSLLAAPWELTLLPQMAGGTLRAQEDGLRREWRTDNGAWQAQDTWRAIVNTGAQRQDIDAQDTGAAARGHHYDLQVGGSYRPSEQWRVGVLGGAYRQNLKAGQEDSRYTLDSYLASAFAQFQHQRWWLDAAFTGGYQDYRDLQRTFALGISERTEKGHTKGALWAATTRLGFNLAPSASHWQLAPFLSGAYSHITVDGYRERSQRSTALAVDKQTLTSRRLGAGVLGSIHVLPGTRLSAELAHEHEFNNDRQRLTMSQITLPTLDYRLEGFQPAERLNRVSLGVDQQLTKNLALQADYSLMKTDDLSQQGINLGLRLSF